MDWNDGFKLYNEETAGAEKGGCRLWKAVVLARSQGRGLGADIAQERGGCWWQVGQRRVKAAQMNAIRLLSAFMQPL